jgi:hypothetical protein
MLHMVRPCSGPPVGIKDYEFMAIAPIVRVERDLRHVAYVDSNSRKNSACTHTEGESLVEYRPVYITSRTYNVNDVPQGSAAPNRL